MGEIPPTDKKKIVLVTAILAVLLILGFLLYTYRQAETKRKIEESGKGKLILLKDETDSEHPARMNLSVSSNKVSVGSTVQLSVSLSSGGKSIFGSDAVLKYDPALIEVVEGSLVTTGLFQSYPRVEAKGGGTIKVTAYGSKEDIGRGENAFFRVTFKTLRPGTGRIAFDFEKGSTSGTTVVEQDTSKNILGSAGEAFIEVVE